MSKKILLLLLLLVPLFANAQYWYKANALRIDTGKGTKADNQWQKCNVRIYIDENRNVKIFTSSTTLVYRAIDDEYIHKVSNNGDAKLFWRTLDGDGNKCVVYYMHDKHVSFLYLGLKYNDMKVWYDMKPDN